VKVYLSYFFCFFCLLCFAVYYACCIAHTSSKIQPVSYAFMLLVLRQLCQKPNKEARRNFIAQRYARAVHAVVMCLSVCPSVCPSQASIVSKRLDWVLAMGLPSTYCVLYRVSKKFGYLQNKRIYLFQTRELKTFVPANRLRCQQNSLTVEFVDYTCDGRRVVAGLV